MSGFLNTLKKAAAAGSNIQRTSGAPETTEMRFTIQPAPGDSGFAQWASAMKMVSQLPGGIPPEFRRRLWLTLAEKHLASRGVNWSKVERSCFSEWSHPADGELGVQIVKDLHRTGCSLFCGEDGQENQALLKRVLLAYARWNKAVGYCQGFNMLAALILQVTDKCEADALKLMIYLIEGVLPDSYFADSLRGLSVDMAVFRELLRSKLPRLSRHLDALQAAAKDGTTSYEPPLTNVFTMQWFLTLFCNCLPQPTVLRVWDLILLEGNEILLRTALAIWQVLAERILSVRSADEFYCIMGVLTRELLEFNLVDANSLIKAVVTIGPLMELKNLREHYLYNINPWGASMASFSSNENERQVKLYPKERLILDISALKKQYVKLKQRQRQAHIIFNAAVTRQPPRATPVAMNHLLLGKSALVPAKRLGPPKGAIPPARQPPSTLHWKDTVRSPSSSSSSDTELCDEPGEEESPSDEEQQNNKSSQFETDNPNTCSDNKNLMIKDNTCENFSATVTDQTVKDTKQILSELIEESKISVDVNQDVQIISDINVESSDVASSELYDFVKTEQTVVDNYDDDGFDFEKFLEERVRCLKNTTVESETSPEELDESVRIECGRKNSQLALQIMQENSLILHRILQCQARLSPSPPIEDEDKISTESPCCSTSIAPTETMDNAVSLQKIEFDKYSITTTSDISPITSFQPEKIITDYPLYEDIIYKLTEQEVISPMNSNKMEDIFDLVSIETDSGNVITTEQKPNDVNKSPDEIRISESLSKYSSILEYSKNLDEKYNTLILNSTISNIGGKKFGSSVEEEETSTSIISSPISDCVKSSEILYSPTTETAESSTLKSPNKIYNPFPVKMNSRQNKDVGVRLGLYKK